MKASASTPAPRKATDPKRRKPENLARLMKEPPAPAAELRRYRLSVIEAL